MAPYLFKKLFEFQAVSVNCRTVGDDKADKYFYTACALAKVVQMAP